MSVNWGLLGIIFLVIVVLFTLATVVVMYIRHWASRNEMAVETKGEGTYFKRYIPESQARQDHQMLAQKRDDQAGKMHRIKFALTAGIASLLVLAVSVSLYVNRDKLAGKIELTQAELNSIATIHHDWNEIRAEVLPDLDKELASLATVGLVFITPAHEYTDKRLNILHDNARSQWKEFADKHHLDTAECHWQELVVCQNTYDNWIYIVTPGDWQIAKLGALMRAGNSVLFYGPPLQIARQIAATQPVQKHFDLFGLKFKPFVETTDNKLALVGDQELTLGFDAGVILDVGNDHNFYTATSIKPQAISIDSSHRSGGEIKTRMYAQTIGNGRFVWMDFLPNADMYAESLDRKYFDAIIASTFRYLQKHSYQSIATWPNGMQFAAIMEEDTEDKFHLAEPVSDFFAENNYPVTWYMLANEAQYNRALTRKLSESGQVACHGDNHQAFTLNDTRMQHERIARCRKVIQEITGKEVTTFRPPQEKHNGYTLDALINNRINSYIAEHGVDRFVPTIRVSRVSGEKLVSIPRMVTDDYELWNDMKADQSTSERIASNEIDFVETVGGLYMFSFHTQFMDNEGNFAAVRYIANLLDRKKAFFATARDISDWWTVRMKLVQGKPVEQKQLARFLPVMLRVDKQGKLSSKRYQPRLYAHNK
jgi:peptidoglycan/xylan/chitin deacetylase (PgdA/CDA1 family)